MDTGIPHLLEAGGLSRSELSRRAGVQRSTLYRVLEGSADVRLSTLRELAFAAGFQLDLRYRALSDPAAADAARVLLDLDAALLAEPIPSEVAEWIERIERHAGEGATRDIIEAAGRAAAVGIRPEAITMTGDFTVDRLASCGYAMGSDWALSGASALEALGVDPPIGAADRPVGAVQLLWVEAPELAAQLLLDTGRVSSGPGDEAGGLGEGIALVICSPSAYTLSGATNIEGIRLVSPVQGMIDCVGLGAAERRLALDLVEGW